MKLFVNTTPGYDCSSLAQERMMNSREELNNEAPEIQPSHESALETDVIHNWLCHLLFFLLESLMIMFYWRILE